MKAIDDKIRKVHETYWTTEKLTAHGMAAVLLVEGDDDKHVIEEIFYRKSRGWEKTVRIVPAGGRRMVIQRMGPKSTFPAAYGLVDRDTWSDPEVAEQRNDNVRLYVTDGWCIENIFLQPDFLQQYNPRVAAIVATERERWVRAGAFWWTMQRAREAQQRWQDPLDWSKNYGAPHESLDFSSPKALLNTLTKRISSEVCKDARLDFDAIADGFEKRLEYVLNLSNVQQWQIGVHGKCVFEKILVPALETYAPPKDPDGTWRGTLAKQAALGRPAPFDELIALLFL